MFLNPQTHTAMKPGNNDIAYNSRLCSTPVFKEYFYKTKDGNLFSSKRLPAMCNTYSAAHHNELSRISEYLRQIIKLMVKLINSKRPDHICTQIMKYKNLEPLVLRNKHLKEKRQAHMESSKNNFRNILHSFCSMSVKTIFIYIVRYNANKFQCVPH